MNARHSHYQPAKLGRVLIVEDEELTGRAIQRDLERKNISADLCRNIESAVTALKTESYHALVTDIYLNSHEPNGLELIRLAKQYGLPSILITSSLNLYIAKAGLNEGADHLLEKPFPVEKLMSYLSDVWDSPKGLIARRERYLDLHQLTSKEKELCRLMLKGLSNKEIAEVVGSTVGTIKFYSSQIFQKFEVGNRAELFSLVFPT